LWHAAYSEVQEVECLGGHLPVKTYEATVDIILDRIKAALARSDCAELPNFGILSIRYRERRRKHNSRTGGAIKFGERSAI